MRVLDPTPQDTEGCLEEINFDRCVVLDELEITVILEGSLVPTPLFSASVLS